MIKTVTTKNTTNNIEAKSLINFNDDKFNDLNLKVFYS